MKKYIFLSFVLMLSLCVQAQLPKKIKSITLISDTKVTFQLTQDSAHIVLSSELDTLGIKIYENNQSTDFLYSQIKSIEFYGYIDPLNVNCNNAEDLKKNPEGWRLEFPRFYQGEDITYEISHSTPDYGVSYSIEWDGTKRANRWSCYERYHNNMVLNYNKRSDAWDQDPNIPIEHSTTWKDYSNSGYSRGHLCPSNDRKCSYEQNKQTFYYSNMQPQMSGHNTGVWSDLEGYVTYKWSPANDKDTLYIVKGGTIDGTNIYKKTLTGMIVPKYFYMALLYFDKSENSYRALGIWTLHRSTATAEYITIDELEKRTGIDFFCNLPDKIEDAVESNLDKNKWGIPN